MSEEPFNPLDISNLAISVGNALFDMDPVPMNSLSRFSGAGMYAVYYSGNNPAYELLAAANSEEARIPIYVGKADAPGSRQGLAVNTSSTALFNRLSQHRSSIDQVDSLSSADFSVRWLVVDQIWVSLGENVLISRFAPVWNSFLDGFGNHAPGRGRANGMRPRWDTLHPGRGWALELAERAESAAQIQAEVDSYLRHRLPALGDSGVHLSVDMNGHHSSAQIEFEPELSLGAE